MPISGGAIRGEIMMSSPSDPKPRSEMRNCGVRSLTTSPSASVTLCSFQATCTVPSAGNNRGTPKVCSWSP